MALDLTKPQDRRLVSLWPLTSRTWLVSERQRAKSFKGLGLSASANEPKPFKRFGLSRAAQQARVWARVAYDSMALEARRADFGLLQVGRRLTLGDPPEGSAHKTGLCPSAQREGGFVPRRG